MLVGVTQHLVTENTLPYSTQCESTTSKQAPEVIQSSKARWNSSYSIVQCRSSGCQSERTQLGCIPETLIEFNRKPLKASKWQSPCGIWLQKLCSVMVSDWLVMSVSNCTVHNAVLPCQKWGSVKMPNTGEATAQLFGLLLHQCLVCHCN
jgi:hypothetical protein